MAFQPRQAPDYQGAASRMGAHLADTSAMMTYAEHKRQRDDRQAEIKLQKEKDDRDYFRGELDDTLSLMRQNRLEKKSDERYKEGRGARIGDALTTLNTQWRKNQSRVVDGYDRYKRDFKTHDSLSMSGESATPMGIEDWAKMSGLKYQPEPPYGLADAKKYLDDPDAFITALTESNDANAAKAKKIREQEIAAVSSKEDQEKGQTKAEYMGSEEGQMRELHSKLAKLPGGRTEAQQSIGKGEGSRIHGSKILSEEEHEVIRRVKAMSPEEVQGELANAERTLQQLGDQESLAAPVLDNEQSVVWGVNATDLKFKIKQLEERQAGIQKMDADRRVREDEDAKIRTEIRGAEEKVHLEERLESLPEMTLDARNAAKNIFDEGELENLTEVQIEKKLEEAARPPTNDPGAKTYIEKRDKYIEKRDKYGRWGGPRRWEGPAEGEIKPREPYSGGAAEVGQKATSGLNKAEKWRDLEPEFDQRGMRQEQGRALLNKLVKRIGAGASEAVGKALRTRHGDLNFPKSFPYKKAWEQIQKKRTPKGKKVVSEKKMLELMIKRWEENGSLTIHAGADD